MANIGQATFVGSEVVILCDDEWTCCQREQAKAKVDGYNKKTPLKIRQKVQERSKMAKERCQARASRAMDNAMAENQAAAADRYATSPCLAEQLKEPGASRSGNGLQMDHPIEVKVGGRSNTTLRALDADINNFFGNAFAKNTGNNMLAQDEEEITSVSLVCSPPCTPPAEGDEDNDYSTGSRSSYPSSPDPSTVSPKRALA